MEQQRSKIAGKPKSRATRTGETPSSYDGSSTRSVPLARLASLNAKLKKLEWEHQKDTAFLLAVILFLTFWILLH